MEVYPLEPEWEGANLVGYDIVNETYTGRRGKEIVWMRGRNCTWRKKEFEMFLDRAAIYYVNCPYVPELYKVL